MTQQAESLLAEDRNTMYVDFSHVVRFDEELGEQIEIDVRLPYLALVVECVHSNVATQFYRFNPYLKEGLQTLVRDIRAEMPNDEVTELATNGVGDCTGTMA